MVGALGGKAECADGTAAAGAERPKSPAPPDDLMFSPPVTARRVAQVFRTLYDTMQQGKIGERIYLTRFERKVKLFIAEHLESPKGIKVPAEMYITANETMKVATISRDYQASQHILGCELPMSSVPDGPTLSKTIIGYMAQVPNFLNYLKNDKAWFDRLKMPEGLSLEADPDELKHRKIFRQLLALMDALIAEDVSRDSAPLKDMAEKLKLEINGQGEMFDDLDEALESIIGFIAGGELTEGIDSEKEMFEFFYDAILSDLFKTDQPLRTGLFSTLKKAFAIYDQNMEYIRTLCTVKQDHTIKYFENFAHKELQLEMEDMLATTESVGTFDYQEYEDRCKIILDKICLNPGDLHPDVAPLLILKSVFESYLVKAFENDDDVPVRSKAQINAQALLINKFLRQVDIRRIDELIIAQQWPVLSPEDAIKVVREVAFDPRCKLIKDSYLALFETLARMKSAIDKPIVTYKPF